LPETLIDLYENRPDAALLQHISRISLRISALLLLSKAPGAPYACETPHAMHNGSMVVIATPTPRGRSRQK
jgi:hypothetical protein